MNMLITKSSELWAEEAWSCRADSSWSATNSTVRMLLLANRQEDLHQNSPDFKTVQHQRPPATDLKFKQLFERVKHVWLKGIFEAHCVHANII